MSRRTASAAITHPRSGTHVVSSADGTRVAYETTGSGPALVLVDGALCYREMGSSRAFATALADRFSVTIYDRRGRGESGRGNTGWSVEREVEDLRAVVAAVGGHAHLLGFSSGAVLCLEAARLGAPVDRVVCYEAPLVLDQSHCTLDPGFPQHVQRLVDEGRRGAAVNAFLRRVGLPAPVRLVMRALPVWRTLVEVAHTLPADLSLVAPLSQGTPIPEHRYAGVHQPVLAVGGGKSPEHMRTAAAGIAAAVPAGTVATLPGQTHMVKPDALSPLVTEHLLA